jgi:hypothetical protein
MVAFAGFVVVIAIALMLLYRVYVHHRDASPYDDDDSAVVRLDVKIATRLG